MKNALSLAALALAAPIPLIARAEVFMSAEQAALSLLPGVQAVEKNVELTPSEIATIEKNSAESVRDKQVRFWQGPKGQVVVIDRVVGKHDFITYAVALSADDKVRGIEILEYRETYGDEIRRQAWRDQFAGKGPADELKLGKDIKNISGATLSCSHLTAGVRRVVQTYAAIRSRAG